MSQAFNSQEFELCFSQVKQIKPRMQPYIAEIKKHNMQWIIGSLQVLHKLIHDDKVQFNLKFGSLFGLKVVFDLGDVFIVNLIQMYFLQKLLQIAGQEIDKPNEKRGQNYFLKCGYPKQTPQISRLSFTWVKLATQFLCAAAVVKPRKMFQTEELERHSDYALALNKLQQAGWKRNANFAYYKEGVPQKIRELYEQNLDNLSDQSIDNFSNYYSALYQRFIQTGRPFQGRLNPQKLIQKCDSFATSGILNTCIAQFKSPELKVRTQVLKVFNQMIKWGDIEAAHVVNCTDFLDEVAKEVGVETDSTKIARSKIVFKKSSQSDQIKRQFHTQFLKCIQFWSLCYPRAIKKGGGVSKVKNLHDELRNELQLQFPEDRQLKEKKAIFDKAIERQRQRNQKLLAQLNEVDPEYTSFIKKLPLNSQSKIPLTSQSKIPENIKEEVDIKPVIRKPTQGQTPVGDTPVSDYDIWKRQIEEVNNCIDHICDDKDTFQIKSMRIVTFRARYQTDFETADMGQKEFDQIFMLIEPLLEKVQKAELHIEKYKAKKCTFQELSFAISGKKPAIKVVSSETIQVKPPSPIKAEIKPPSPQKPSIKQEIRSQFKEQSIKKVSQSSIPKQLNKKIEPEKIKQEDISVSSSGLPKIPDTLISRTEEQHEKRLTINLETNQNKQMKIIPEDLGGEMTPIKKGKEFIDNLGSRDLSDLPEVSRQSVQKELGLLEPASHARPEVIKINSDEVSIDHRVEHELKGVKQNTDKMLEKIQGNLNELDEEIQQGVGANIPKSLKNAGGAYKIQKQYEKQESSKKGSPKKDKKMSVTLIESKKQSKVNFDQSLVNSKLQKSQSKVKEYQAPQVQQRRQPKLVEEQPKNILDNGIKIESKEILPQQNLMAQQILPEDDDDIIMMPDSNPLQQSFHQLNFLDKEPQKPKQLSFKKCFQEDKYLFGGDRLTKKFKLATDTFNLRKRSNSSGKKNKKDSSISIPSILNQRNKKYEEEMKYLEEKKNRKIYQLESKIKVLETNGQVMKQKIFQKDREIQSIRAYSQIDGSVKKANILQDQDIVFKRLSSAQQNKSVKQRSFYGGDALRDPKYLDPMGKLINNRRFSNYFQQFKNEKQKRLLVKNKQLLLKTDAIQFGCMSKRQKDTLVITFYITPSVDLNGLVSRANLKDENLNVDIQPKNVPVIRKGKQEKIIVNVTVNEAPYYLPQIQFSYNLEDKLETQRFIIPCAFHKFVSLMPIKYQELQRQFQKRDLVRRGQEVPYSRKLLKNINLLTDYFPGGSILRNGEPNDKGEVQFIGRAVWRRQQFLIRLMIRPNQFLYVQMLCYEQTALGEFYSSLITNLLMKNIELQEL